MDRNITRRRLLQGAAAGAAGAVAVSLAGRPTPALAGQAAWDLTKAAEPYKGVSINAPFLQRPAYDAAARMIPEFEQLTGIKVNYEVMPYENSREKQVLDFTGGTGLYDIALIDLVWLGEYAASEWIVPLETFYNNPELADPAFDLQQGFFPILLDASGTWNGIVYGLPFDNYTGLLYYNKAMLEAAGFTAPPRSWQELYDTYGPALTKDGQYAFALQSRRGETQSADSFMRMVWAFGGSLLDSQTFEPRLSAPTSLSGLQFRQDLMQYMPPDIVEWDHDETVQGLAQGRVAMITEWSAFYPTLSNPETSTIADSLGVTIEPAGTEGPAPALGGISLGITAQSPEEKQAAAWLFIQWLNSEAKAKEYIEYGGISGRDGVYEDPELRERYPYFEPVAESFSKYGNPIFRPRFPEWPQISEIIAQTGSEMMLGQMSIQDGVATIEDQMRQILQPYIAGDKPKLQ